jgi:hypothetical protein
MKQRLNLHTGGVVVNDVVCINLKKRKIRRQQIKREAKKKGFPFRIFPAIENQLYPNLGKFESHIRCIQEAKKNKCPAVLILEDDVKFLTPKLMIPPPPVNWDMLFLGGNIQSVIQDDDTDNSKTWKRGSCLMCHAYVVKDTAYDTILAQGWKMLKDHPKDATLNIDEWFCREIHSQLRVYIATPELAIQNDGYSDVKKKDVIYRQQLTAGLEGPDGCVAPARLSMPEYEEITNEQGEKFMKLKLPSIDDTDLPSVALITCVHNQADLFQFIQWTYYNIDYPRDKLTWVIVDDSAHLDKVAPLIDGQDASIKYVSCKMGSDSEFLSIARKFNIAMSYVGTATKYILNYSLESYYNPLNVKARVRLMMAYPEYGCFGCTRYGVYDISNLKSWEQVSADGRGNPTILFAPSISFTKDFWLARSFDETQYTMETFYFIRGRWNLVMDIPYNFVLCALTWTGHLFSETGRYGIKGKALTSSITGTASSSDQDNVSRVTGVLSDADNNNNVIRAEQQKLDYTKEWDLTTNNMISMLGSILTPDKK